MKRKNYRSNDEWLCEKYGWPPVFVIVNLYTFVNI